MKCSRIAAHWLIGIGVLHCALFLWFERRILASIAGEGLWNTVDPIRDRQVLFWALLTGLFGILLGQLALWIARQGTPLPAFLGWQIIGVTLLCGVLMPYSGGWLFAVPGTLIVAGGRGSAPGRA